MSKTLYYRETDPNSGKQKWVKLNGVRGTNFMIFINAEQFRLVKNPIQFVYKRSREE